MYYCARSTDPISYHVYYLITMLLPFSLASKLRHFLFLIELKYTIHIRDNNLEYEVTLFWGWGTTPIMRKHFYVPMATQNEGSVFSIFVAPESTWLKSQKEMKACICCDGFQGFSQQHSWNVPFTLYFSLPSFLEFTSYPVRPKGISQQLKTTGTTWLQADFEDRTIRPVQRSWAPPGLIQNMNTFPKDGCLLLLISDSNPILYTLHWEQRGSNLSWVYSRRPPKIAMKIFIGYIYILINILQPIGSSTYINKYMFIRTRY